MSAPWNNSGRIDWDNLNRKLINDWYTRASKAHGVDRFLFAFICLNHYYSAWADIKQKSTMSDRQQMRHLGTLPTLIDKWQVFITLQEVKGQKISLPLKDRKKQDVPQNLSHSSPLEYEASGLNIADYLEVMYQLRCDLFHANRGASGFQNESVIKFVANPSLNLVKYLIMDTTLS